MAQKQSEASKLLQQLEAVGSIDPQVALLLRQCGSYCRLVHLSRNAPRPLVKEAFALFDDRVQQCFSECTAVDASAATWPAGTTDVAFCLRLERVCRGRMCGLNTLLLYGYTCMLYVLFEGGVGANCV